MKTSEITKQGIFLALFFIASNLIPPIMILGVPFTFQTVIILLIPFFFNLKEIIIWFTVLILMCALGLPIMSNFSGGISVLIGPTAGFIYGWLLKMLVIKIGLTNNNGIIYSFIVMFIATVIDLACGALWLSTLNNTDVLVNLQVILTGFLPFGVVKIILVQLVIKRIPSGYLDQSYNKEVA